MLTLALGIGANTAIFTLVHAVLMKSLPVADPATLYRIGDRDSCCVNGGFPNDDGDFDLFSYELFVTCNNRRWNFRSSQTFSQDTAGLIPDEHQARRRTQRRKPWVTSSNSDISYEGVALIPEWAAYSRIVNRSKTSVDASYLALKAHAVPTGLKMGHIALTRDPRRWALLLSALRAW